MSNHLIRNPSVANQFYPANVIELQAQLDIFLNVKDNLKQPKAIITPHAGYIYSGAVAGKVYASLKQAKDTIKKVVLFGPAHRLGFQGIASSNVDGFLTPLGTIPIAKDLLALALEKQQVFYEERAFDGEHCLEVQLPFLQSVLNNFEIAPFVVGECLSQDVADVMTALWGNDETLIVISSDLSHFLDYDACQAKDRLTANNITNKKYNKIADDDACGRTPIKALLRLAEKNNMQLQEIDVCNSGDTAGTKDRVVGYGSWLCY